MTTKIKGTEGVEFPDASVQASAAFTKAQSDVNYQKVTGQTYQNMNSSRSPGVDYTNNTGQQIWLLYSWESADNGVLNCSVSVNGTMVAWTYLPPGGAGFFNRATLSVPVPANSTFRYTQTAAATRTLMELR